MNYYYLTFNFSSFLVTFLSAGNPDLYLKYDFPAEQTAQCSVTSAQVSGHIVASIAQYTLNCDLTLARWLGLGIRASNEGSRRFHNHREDP